ncbi:MAG TPA: hypothetical protein VIL21_03560 [Solirubrobacterales bacterium]|jgi:hypothetical protein
MSAVVLAALAVVTALGGTVYAAGKINGHSIKVKSLPGNRLALKSVPGNRLKPGAIKGSQLAPGSITGVQVDVSTLGQVPAAAHADTAGSAHDAETAINAVNAENAQKVGGYEAGCKPGSRLFGGACWQLSSSEAPTTPANAAAKCTSQGGELPDALSLAAFAGQPGVVIDEKGEWTGTLATFSGKNSFSMVIVLPGAAIDSEVSSATLRFRCVLPLLS